jgi:DNA replication protein DnaC
MTFEALIPEGRKGRVDEARFGAATETAQKFAAEPNGWLVFEGSTGSGKTHLAAAIVNEIIDRGSPAKYVSALDIPDLLRNERFDDSDDSEGGTFTSLFDAPMLVIDDLGAQQTANWIDSKIDQLLTHRFNRFSPTVVLLAKPISEMPERIALKLDDPTLSQVLRLTSVDDASVARQVNIPASMMERMTFETFNHGGAPSANLDERASLGMALTAARDFAENPEKWLYLHGPTGVGKTHMAVAIANVRAEKGTSITFWSVPDLLDNLRHTYSNPNESTFYALFDSVRNCELLILDDFGAQQMTDWALEKLYQLISHRHDRLLPTVVTSQYILWEGADNSNWNRVRGKHQWESIRSRLSDSSVVTERLMAAPDYRNRGA